MCNNTLPFEEMKVLAHQIVELFPGEIKEAYFKRELKLIKG